ncbi:MAG: hypothetical protein H0T92_07945 [Pyrinomonadaceae bacterium]|nr:hypothetical protein [Pyrinomonadaceae bacterium]
MLEYPGATTEESVRVKLDTYLLNPDHPDGKSKARWFAAALGFNRNNMDKLAKQIVFKSLEAVPAVSTPFEQKFRQMISIVGTNGRQIDIAFVWIQNDDGVTRLVTSLPTKKQRKQYV